MAHLVLTDEEKAAALWTDLDDDALGKLMRRTLAAVKTAAEQKERTVAYACGLLICCDAAEANATELRMELEGVTQAGREFGDWVVVATRKTHNVRGNAHLTAAQGVEDEQE